MYYADTQLLSPIGSRQQIQKANLSQQHRDHWKEYGRHQSKNFLKSNVTVSRNVEWPSSLRAEPTLEAEAAKLLVNISTISTECLPSAKWNIACRNHKLFFSRARKGSVSRPAREAINKHAIPTNRLEIKIKRVELSPVGGDLSSALKMSSHKLCS
ncbi:hypothetical protein chiPu_0013355 [Chiloscyllium punctatum]|uniref:Uncharacterized protein n=1 Tax=Chiloscyllium punctatum TaxID=137246 RepID=A0A401SWW2_CHIPU|nr:hypothetical protein [Chiloscyllium punctatum]